MYHFNETIHGYAFFLSIQRFKDFPFCMKDKILQREHVSYNHNWAHSLRMSPWPYQEDAKYNNRKSGNVEL